MQDIPYHPIWIKTTDPNKHNIIWIERCSIHQSVSERRVLPALGLRLKSAYVLLRNIDFSHNNASAIDIVLDSEINLRNVEVIITQNNIWYSRKGGAIHILNTGITDATVHITSNDIRHNSAQDVCSVIQIVNVTLFMDSNVIYNNSGRFILELGSDNLDIANTLPQNISNNLFWLNSAHQPSSYTISANATKVFFQYNLLNNPVNSYEFSARISTPRPALLDCTDNWWGTGQLHEVKDKIRSSSNTMGLPDVTYLPAWLYPQTQYSLSCKL